MSTGRADDTEQQTVTIGAGLLSPVANQPPPSNQPGVNINNSRSALNANAIIIRPSQENALGLETQYRDEGAHPGAFRHTWDKDSDLSLISGLPGGEYNAPPRNNPQDLEGFNNRIAQLNRSQSLQAQRRAIKQRLASGYYGNNRQPGNGKGPPRR